MLPTDAYLGLANMLMVDPPTLTFASAYIVETLTLSEVHETFLLLNRSISSKCLSTIGGAQWYRDAEGTSYIMLWELSKEVELRADW